MKICVWLVAFTLATELMAKPKARSIFLNGVDISSAKNQALFQVNVRIDAQGHVYIEAPQYEVQQETSFVPLGRPLPNQDTTPEHKPPGPLMRKVESPAGAGTLPEPAEAATPDGAPAVTEPSNPAMLPKEGSRQLPASSPPVQASGSGI